MAMWFNFKTKECDPPGLLEYAKGGTSLVDGVEIKHVWYADTKLGEVKTYDVLGDGKGAQFGPAVARQHPELCERPDIHLPNDGPASRTIHGTVEILPRG